MSDGHYTVTSPQRSVLQGNSVDTCGACVVGRTLITNSCCSFRLTPLTGGDGLRVDRHGLFHPSLTEGEDTPHSSPSQTGGLLSAETAPPLTTGAELETPNASTVPSLPVKAHPSTLLAGGWSGRAPSGDRFLREGSPGDKQGQELKTSVLTTALS